MSEKPESNDTPESTEAPVAEVADATAESSAEVMAESSEPPAEASEPPAEASAESSEPPAEASAEWSEPPAESSAESSEPPAEVMAESSEPPAEASAESSEPPAEASAHADAGAHPPRAGRPAEGGRGRGPRESRPAHQRPDEAGADPAPELRKLLELATKYPEIGPPLAELAFKLNQSEIAERVVRLGLEGQGAGVEYYFVLAHAARREKRWSDALRATADAIAAFEKAPAESVGPEDGGRLLHLIRLGFSTLMFDMQNINAEPGFIDTLAGALPGLEPRLGSDPFYRTLLAQTLWFRDRDASEAEWDRAATLTDSEFTWNARGTWYREAERDEDKAERAYRAGLHETPRSALLLHNLAQVLVERAARAVSNQNQHKHARRLLNESDDLLRAALREDAPRVRRYIHSTRDRLNELRRKLPKPPRRPDQQQQQQQQQQQGPRSNDRQARDQRPPQQRDQRPPQQRDQRDQRDQNRGRDQRDQRDQGRGRDQRDQRDQRDRPPRPKQDSFLTEGTVSLGDMLLAKLKEQQSKG